MNVHTIMRGVWEKEYAEEFFFLSSYTLFPHELSLAFPFSTHQNRASVKNQNDSQINALEKSH